MIDTVIKPMHPEGYKFVAAFAVVTLVLFWLWEPLGWLGLGLTVWCYYFFRDPKRSVPENAGLLVSPADGVVSLIERAVPPAELGMGPEALVRVSVFMSVFNCHVNRAPIAGRVTAVAYRPGKFFNASLDKASEENERNALHLRTNDGRDVTCVQVAGLVARRILCYAKPGERLARGQRYGFIRFGSRVDLYLPPGARAMVTVGDKVSATATVLAELP
jgi:phosphatidylserine decarboxylase